MVISRVLRLGFNPVTCVRTLDTCMVSSWPRAFKNTAINLHITHETSWILYSLTEMVPGEVKFHRVAYRHVGLDVTISVGYLTDLLSFSN